MEVCMSIWELNNIIEALGITSGVYALILALSLGLFYILLNRAIENSNDKLLAKYTIEQQHCYDKLLAKYTGEEQHYLDVAFRDEKVRAAVMPDIIANGDKERIRIYHRVYRLFFKIQRSRWAIKDKQQAIIGELTNEINDVKNDIILNYIYLGEFIDYLHNIPAYLMDDLNAIISGNVRNEYKDEDAKIGDEDITLITTRRVQNKYNPEKSYDALWKAAQWIMKNMKLYLTFNCVELSDKQIEKSHQTRDEILKTYSNNSTQNEKETVHI
jgi:hypothetical protein